MEDGEKKPPLLLLGINGWIVKEYQTMYKDYLELPASIRDHARNEKKWKFWSPSFVKIVLEWSEKCEIRFCSSWAQDSAEVAAVVGLPNFSVCELERLDEDKKRPVILLADRDHSLDFFSVTRRMSCEIPFLHVKYWDSDSVGQQVCHFLRDISITSCEISVYLVRIANDGCLPDGFNRYAKDQEKLKQLPVVTVTLKNIQEILTLAELKRVVIDLFLKRQMHGSRSSRGFVSELENLFLCHPEAIFTHIDCTFEGNEKNNLVVNALRNSHFTMYFVFPNELPLSQISPQIQPSPHRPLMFLDVDGVVNAIPYMKPEFQVEFSDAKETKCTHGITTWPINYSPTVVAKINAWSELAEIRWLTSWRHDARYRLAPLIGLKDFQVCSFFKWQAKQVEVHKESDLDRPIIWIDDDELDEKLATIARNQVLFVRPKNFLSKQDLDTVDQFLVTVLIAPDTSV
jgi:hypothetical protein